MAQAATRKRGRPRARAASPLSRWLDDHGRTREWAAGKLGVTRPYLDKLCRAAATPSLDVATGIEHLTGGEVSASSWSRTKPRTRK
jgi:hypothetical protein